MLVVVERLRRQLSGQERQLQHFSERQYQAEGWIKAGFLQLLDELKEQGLVESVEREKLCGRGREKVDVVFQVRGVRHWVELKHWLIGPQKGTVWKLPAYFAGT